MLLAKGKRLILISSLALSWQLCKIHGFALDILENANLYVKQNIRENYGQAVAVRIENLVIKAPSPFIAFTHTILRPLQVLCGPNYKGRQIIIVVEALDEAAQENQDESIIDLLANIGNLPSQVR